MPCSISLVMPSLNAQEFIGAALDSVRAQNYKGELEVVVADGGSSDETLDIVARYDFARVPSGEDNGIYEGFNRGIEAARYDIVGILNADDLLLEGALFQVDQSFNEDSELDFVSGGATSGDPSGSAPALFNTSPLSAAGALFGIPAINARFFRREVFDRIGLFVPEAGIAADREFMLRVTRAGLKGTAIDMPLYHYRVHGGSTTIAGDHAAQQRVWRAEIDLADYLLAQPDLPPNEHMLARRARLLVELKRKISKKSLFSENRRGATHFATDWPQLLPAILTWRQWRGRLSGF